MSHRSEVHVHVHRHLGIEGRQAACEVVGHVPFGDATNTFLEHVMETYRQLAIMEPTVIMGDFNATNTVDSRGGQPTPDTAVIISMQHPGLQDLTASLLGQASHRPAQPGSTDSRIDPGHVEVTRTR